jgi:hypothetical protein
MVKQSSQYSVCRGSSIPCQGISVAGSERLTSVLVSERPRHPPIMRKRVTTLPARRRSYPASEKNIILSAWMRSLNVQLLPTANQTTHFPNSVRSRISTPRRSSFVERRGMRSGKLWDRKAKQKEDEEAIEDEDEEDLINISCPTKLN